MEKILNWLFASAFVSVLIRSFLVGASISDAVVLISLIAALIYSQVIVQKKIDSEEKLKEEMKIITDALHARMDEIGNKVSAINLKQGINRINLNEKR